MCGVYLFKAALGMVLVFILFSGRDPLSLLIYINCYLMRLMKYASLVSYSPDATCQKLIIRYFCHDNTLKLMLSVQLCIDNHLKHYLSGQFALIITTIGCYQGNIYFDNIPKFCSAD